MAEGRRPNDRADPTHTNAGERGQRTHRIDGYAEWVLKSLLICSVKQCPELWVCPDDNHAATFPVVCQLFAVGKSQCQSAVRHIVRNVILTPIHGD